MRAGRAPHAARHPLQTVAKKRNWVSGMNWASDRRAVGWVIAEYSLSSSASSGGTLATGSWRSGEMGMIALGVSLKRLPGAPSSDVPAPVQVDVPVAAMRMAKRSSSSGGTPAPASCEGGMEAPPGVSLKRFPGPRSSGGLTPAP